jgi:hypothetical protein
MDKASFKTSAEELGDCVRPKIEEAKQEIERLNGRMSSFIQRHPTICLAGAVALGYVVAQVARRQR